MTDKLYTAARDTDVTIICQYCNTPKTVKENSFEASSGCNYFCSGDCEDKFAWFEESIKPNHKEIPQ